MDLPSYLASLPRLKLDALYESPWTCRAVLRSLPPLAKQYVLRMLLLDSALPEEVLEHWHTGEGKAKHHSAMARLIQLRVLEAAPVPRSSQQGFALHPTLSGHLRTALSRGGAKSEPVPEEVMARAPNRAQLDSHALKQWEDLLLYVVGGSKAKPSPHPLLGGVALDVDHLLEGAGLMDAQGRGVAARGYKFLLLDVYIQLWIVLKEYIADAERRSGGDLACAISFLLELGFLEPGRPSPVARLPPAERAIASHLAQLGLLLPFRVNGEVWFCSTRLALALAGSGTAPDTHDGCVIVETNYRVYAYTASPLQCAILRLFVRCECLLPDFFVGTVTRESVLGALKCGLTAQDIVGYLRSHAHPQVASRTPVVPEVVSDMVRLWEGDTQRVLATKAYLYEDFASREMFEKASAYSELHGWRIWEEPGAWRLASRVEGHDEMRSYIRSIK